MSECSHSDFVDGGDCPKCGTEESILYHRDSGRDDEHFECTACEEIWFIFRVDNYEQ